MPYRKVPLITSQIYHVFNRSIGKQHIFISNKDNERFLEVSYYYQFNPNLRFSFYNKLPVDERLRFFNSIKTNNKRIVNFIGFCLMPNHFHFLLKQNEDRGIANFIRNIQNSYAKYFNIRNKRAGGVFQAMFKAVRVESDEQLHHILRYIHLNPYSSFVIKDIDELKNYPWSSYATYLDKRKNDMIDTSYAKFYKNIQAFKKFTVDQADYQRSLEMIKHLTVD